MDSYSVVDDWDVTRFDGGFDGLAGLESRGFSGAVEAGGAWMFFRDGEPLAAVSDLRSTPTSIDIDAFENAEGKRYDAPTPGAATLAAMVALDGDVRGRYFTDDTPLEAVHETLSGGGFTGYVELSENVLSGDYYFVYIDGEVEHLGFVGTAPMISGEEAERKAKNEVGIYAVVAVRFQDLELPEPTIAADETEDELGGIADDSEGEQNSESEPESKPASDSKSAPEPERETGPGPDPTPMSDSEPESEPRAGDLPPAESDRPTAEQTEDEKRSDPSPETGEVSDPAESEAQPSEPERDVGSSGDEESIDDVSDQREQPPTAGHDEGAPTPNDSYTDAPNDDVGAAQATTRRESNGIEAVTVRSVPSLDPEKSSRREPEDGSATGANTARTTNTAQTTDTASERGRRAESTAETSAEKSQAVEATRAEYETQISEYEARIETLESELTEADDRIESLEAELEAVRSERDELRSQLAADDTPSPSRVSLSPTDALAGTSLFIREVSRGEATLEDARDSGVDRETVTENLRIERHTEFEDRDAAVEGESFDSWLSSSGTYAFVEWLVIDLFFEIRSTGSVDALRPLYDALPKIDRISFEDSIAVGSGKDGREVSFDIVARNKKGNPLVVVDFDRRREPTRAETIEPFVTDASDVCEMNESLAAAIAVTSSYFESDAMATAEEATGTSLLSRSKHRSYVKLSRTSGYHLCLVEARDESFNLTVPEL